MAADLKPETLADKLEDWLNRVMDDELAPDEAANEVCELAPAILAALRLPASAQPQQPVAWLIEDSLLDERYTTEDEFEARNMAGADQCKVTPLYLAPSAQHEESAGDKKNA